MVRTIIPLLALLAACSPTYTVKLDNNQPQECRLPYGKALSSGPVVTGTGLSFNVGLDDRRRNSSQRAGITYNPQAATKGATIGLEGTAISLYETGSPSLTVAGLSFSDRSISTPLLSLVNGRPSVVMPFLLPIHTYNTLPQFLESPQRATRDLLFRDTLPVLPLADFLFGIKRILDLPTEVETENLEDTLSQMTSSPIHSQRLSRIEATLGKYPLVDGFLIVIYDEELLGSSFLFWKLDSKEVKPVYSKIKDNLRASLDI